MMEGMRHFIVEKRTVAASVGSAEPVIVPECYQVRDSEHVEEFLAQHEYLAPELEAAPARIAEQFGAAPLALEVRQEDERPNHHYLALVIQTELRGREAFSRLDALYRSWWSAKEPDVFASMLIDVEFI